MLNKFRIWSRKPLGFGVGGLMLLAAFTASADDAVDEAPVVSIAPAAELQQTETLTSSAPMADAGHMIQESAAVIAGKASYYAQIFHGRLAATGEVFRQELMTAASNLFPLGSWLAVRRPGGKCVVVRVNDRMNKRFLRDRIVDLSYSAASHLGMIAKGVAAVEAKLLPSGPGFLGNDCSQAFAN